MLATELKIWYVNSLITSARALIMGQIGKNSGLSLDCGAHRIPRTLVWMPFPSQTAPPPLRPVDFIIQIVQC